MSNSGKWIVIEGLDGAGKTSAVATVQRVFANHGLETKVYREPGGTSLGEKIREILKTAEMNTIGIAEVLLLYAARVQLLQEKVFPNLEAGISVILDRHELSTLAYQSGGRGVDYQDIQQISKSCMPDKKPDLTLFLAIEPKRSLERAAMRGELDHYESQSLTFFQNIALSYERFVEDYPNVAYIDANQTFEVVQEDITKVLADYLKSWCVK
jgi:dTMP kinase